MNDVTCAPRGCAPLPEPFVRLRYFYGKRLGVADLGDEQRYHAGRMRFHNRHLHGSGVLCGLGLSPFDPAGEGGAAGMVLRVARGAALDSCGHELIVPGDMCIDLDAWFRKEQARRGTDWPAELSEDGTLELAVLLCYCERPTSPEAAPRDPCAPQGGGTEYGRVEESFELRLEVASEVRSEEGRSSFPSRDELASAVRGAAGLGSEAAAAALAELLGAGCAGAVEDDCVWLGSFAVTPAERPSDLPEDESAGLASWDPASIVGPVDFLLSTEALQELVLQLLSQDRPSGATLVGFEAVEPSEIPTYHFRIEVGDYEAASLLEDGSQLSLRWFDPDEGWQAPRVLGAPYGLELRATDAGTSPAGIVLEVRDDGDEPALATGRRYVLELGGSGPALVDPSLTPIEGRFRFEFVGSVDEAGFRRFDGSWAA